MSLFNNCLGVVYVQGKQRTAWFISRGPWLMERCQPDDLQDIMFWWHTLQRADGMSDGAWLRLWRDASFTRGKELTLPHGGAAIRNLTLRTHFLFTLMDCRTVVLTTHIFSLWKAKLDLTRPTVILCAYYILILIDFAWFCMISFLSGSIILLLLLFWVFFLIPPFFMFVGKMRIDSE